MGMLASIRTDSLVCVPTRNPEAPYLLAECHTVSGLSEKIVYAARRLPYRAAFSVARFIDASSAGCV